MATGCFYLLAMVNKVVHTGEQTSDTLLSVLLSIYPGVAGAHGNFIVNLK